MTTRAGMLGLGLGGILLVVLFYPLYLAVANLYERFDLLSTATIFMALALTILGGRLAARWSSARRRWQCVGAGALAGGMAALVVFGGLGAAAAGMLSSGAELSSGSLLEAVSRNVVGTQTMFWGLLWAGLLLGATGGRLSTPRPATASRPAYNKADPQMALNVSITAVPATALTVILAAVLFPRIADIAGAPATTSISLVHWPLTTAVLLYLAAHAALTLVTSHEAYQADHRCGIDEVKMAAYVGMAAPLALGATLLLIDPGLTLQPAVSLGLLISLGMSARLIQVLRTIILPRRTQMPPPPNMAQAVLFGSIAGSNWQNLLWLCLGCGLVLAAPAYIAVAAPVLNIWFRLTETMPQRLYLVQAAASFGGAAGAGAILTGLYLFYAALGRWFARRHKNG